MSHVNGVVAADTGRALDEIINSAADQNGIDAVDLLGLLIAESSLHEHAWRDAGWPDTSPGLGQQAIKWIGRDLDGYMRDASGAVLDTPANRERAKSYFFDAANAVPYAAKQFAAWYRKEGDALNAACRYNWPGRTPAANPNRANYARGLAEAERYREHPAPPVVDGIVDLRGQLPTKPEYGTYDARSLDSITTAVIHYTAGSRADTPASVAAYQISAAAAPQTGTGRPFPGIAYHLFVDAASTVSLCNDLSLSTWHAKAANATSVGLCFACPPGADPLPPQVEGLARAVIWCEHQLGRQLEVTGHGDVPGNQTTCPGAGWANWQPTLLRRVAELRAPRPPTPPPVVAPIGRLGLGLNVGRGWHLDQPEAPWCTPEQIVALGVRWVRLTALRGNGLDDELKNYLEACLLYGIDTLLMIGGESLDLDGYRMDYPGAAAWYAQYAEEVSAWQLGNESDHVSPSSWTLPAEELNQLIAAFRAALPGARLIGPGLASGDPGYLTPVDVGRLDAIAVHPYGIRPTLGWPAPDWGFSYLGEVLDRYAGSGKPIWFTEFAVSTTEQTEVFQADYLARFVRSAADYAGRLEALFWFCCADSQVDGYGLRKADGASKTAWEAMKGAGYRVG